MKNARLIKLIESNKLTDLTIGEISYFNVLSDRELTEILKIRDEFRTQTMARLDKKDFINEDNYYYVLSKIQTLKVGFNIHSFLSMACNRDLQSSPYYKEIIDKLISTNCAGFTLFTDILQDNEVSKSEYLSDLIKIVLESNREKLSLVTNRTTNWILLKQLLTNEDLMTNKDKYLTAFRIYLNSYEDETPIAKAMINILTNKHLIEKDNYIDLLEWIKNWPLSNPTSVLLFSNFLKDTDPKIIDTFLFKYNTLNYFIKNGNNTFFDEFLELLNNKTKTAKKSLEFALKTFDTFIKNPKLFNRYMHLATSHGANFLLYDRKYKEVIDISKRIKDANILSAYTFAALSPRIMESKHWRYILNTVASIKCEEIANSLVDFFDNNALLKREDLRTITASTLNCEDRQIQEAFLNIASHPIILAKSNYLAIINLTLTASKTIIEEYEKLATSKSYIGYIYFYEILSYATRINDVEIFRSYTTIVKEISKHIYDKQILIQILQLISNVKDEETMNELEEVFENIDQVIDTLHLKFFINTLTREKDNPNFLSLAYFAIDIDILLMYDYESLVQRFLEIEDKKRAKLICAICDTTLGATHIKDAFELEDIHDLEVLHSVLNQLVCLDIYKDKTSFISKLINTIKSKEKGDLYFILEELSKKDIITQIYSASYETLYQTGVSTIPEFIEEFLKRAPKDINYEEFFYNLRSKKRSIKKEQLLSMLRELNPDDEVDMTKIENILSLTPQA